MSTTTEEAFIPLLSTTCNACRGILTIPKFLPCGHFMCRHCLVVFLRSEPEVECPVCDCVIMDPVKQRGRSAEEVADSLPTDLAMTAMAEAETLLSKQHVCCVCEGVAAVALCLQCRDMLCPNCRDAHKKLSATKHHEVEDLSSLTAERLAIDHPILCRGQKEEASNVYCPTHGTLICQCAATTPDSDSQKPQSQAGELIAELDQLNDILAQSVARADANISLLDRHSEDLKIDCESALEEMKLVCDRLKAAIAARFLEVSSRRSRVADFTTEATEYKQVMIQKRSRITTHRSLAELYKEFSKHKHFQGMVDVVRGRLPDLDIAEGLPENLHGNEKLVPVIDYQDVAEVEQIVLGLGTIATASASLDEKPISRTDLAITANDGEVRQPVPNVTSVPDVKLIEPDPNATDVEVLLSDPNATAAEILHDPNAIGVELLRDPNVDDEVLRPVPNAISVTDVELIEPDRNATDVEVLQSDPNATGVELLQDPNVTDVELFQDPNATDVEVKLSAMTVTGVELLHSVPTSSRPRIHSTRGPMHFNPMTATPSSDTILAKHTQGEYGSPSITSIVSSPSYNELYMADWQNKSINVFSLKLNSLNTTLILDVQPWGLALVKGSLLIVTSSEDDLIMPIDFTDVSKPNTHSPVPTARQYRGIAVLTDDGDDVTLIVSCDKNDVGPASVDVIDLAGICLRTIVTSESLLPELLCPWYLHADTQRDVLYVSDYGANCVFCLQLSAGLVLPRLEHPQLSGPHQVCADIQGNLYAASYWGKCVLVRSLGKEWRVLLSKAELGEWNYPEAVCVTDTGLVVSYYSRNRPGEVKMYVLTAAPLKRKSVVSLKIKLQ